MSAAQERVEHLLREALQPVEPPAAFSARLEAALSSITEAAADELEGWELSAMRDPRNWARPAAALLIGVGAAAGLAALRAQRRQREEAAQKESQAAARLAAATGHAFAELCREASRLVGMGR